MSNNEETKIPLDRRKIALAVAGCLALAGAGIWLVSLDDSRIVSERGFRLLFNSPLFAHGVGWVAIALFGGLAVFSVKKFFDKTPGLVFNGEGIIDNSGLNSAGFIPWDEVEGYDVLEVSGQRMLVIVVSDPYKYASRGNLLKRKLNAANAQMAGSPISISANTLDIGFQDLLSLLEKYHREYSTNRT